MNIFLLMSVKVNSSDQYVSIWGKVKQGFIHAYEEHHNDVDWVLKADDDTFFVMENLRFLLGK